MQRREGSSTSGLCDGERHACIEAPSHASVRGLDKVAVAHVVKWPCPVLDLEIQPLATSMTLQRSYGGEG